MADCEKQSPEDVFKPELVSNVLSQQFRWNHVVHEGKRRGSQFVQKVSRFTETICCSSSITQVVNYFCTYLTQFHLTSVMLEYVLSDFHYEKHPTINA